MNREELRTHLEERVNFFWSEYDRLQDAPEELAKVEVNRQAIEQYLFTAGFVVQIIDSGGFKVIERLAQPDQWNMSRSELLAFLNQATQVSNDQAHAAWQQINKLGEDIPRTDCEVYVEAKLDAERNYNWNLGRRLAFGEMARRVGFYLDQINEDGQIVYRVVERED